MENTDVSSGTDDATPIIWLGYIGVDGLQHALPKDDYDSMNRFLWPADCPMLWVEPAPGERFKHRAFQPGEVPKCWREDQEGASEQVNAFEATR